MDKKREAKLLEKIAELEIQVIEFESEANAFVTEVIVKQQALYKVDVLMDIIMTRTRNFPDILGVHLEMWNDTQKKIKQALVRKT